MKRLATKWFAIGSSLFIVRVKRDFGGKRSGFRTLIVYKKNDRAIFVYGFSKNEKDNVDQSELRLFRKLAKDFISMEESELNQAIRNHVLIDLEELK